jgi:integrase
MLLDEQGVPHWYATLFITTQVRNASKAPNTMLASLSSIRMLFAWASSRSIDLEARFARGDLLGDSEIESLRTYSQSRLDSLSHAKDEVPRVAKRNEDARAAAGPPARRVSGGTHYIRMTYMAEYIEWLGIRLAERDARNVDAGTRSDIKSMAASLLMRRPQKTSRSRLSARKGLIEEAQNRLLEIVRPGSESNPFQPEVQKRNELVVLLLYHLGLRAGELLALKVSDFDFQQNEVVIARRHGDAADPRANQPVVKTMDRRVPLLNSLASAISSYVMTDRRQYPRAKRHSFLFVTHKPGPYQGAPISMKGLAKIFAVIKRMDPVLLKDLDRHVLRHTTNDRLSELMDANQVRAPDEEKMRSYLMGWREGSGTAAIYTRRHVEKKAREASLKLQQVRRDGDKKND